jgi:hypothetical protein
VALLTEWVNILEMLSLNILMVLARLARNQYV